MATKTITINNVSYTIPELDFNAVCDLSDCGVDIVNPQDMQKKPVKSARSIVAWIMGVDEKTAGNTIQAHMLAGGSLIEIFETFSKVVEDSDFFHTLQGQGRMAPQDHRRKTRKAEA